MEYREEILSSQLQGVHFRSLPSIKWSTVFKRLAIQFECGEGILPAWRQRLVLLLKLFYSEYYDLEAAIQEEAEVLFFNSDTDRKSCYAQTKMVSETVEKKDIIQAVGRRFKFHFCLGIRLLILVDYWNRELKNKNIETLYRLSILRHLVNIYYMDTQLMRVIDINKYKALVTFYDSLFYESVLVELFKKMGKTTITLQHGQFTRSRDNNFINSGVELRTFKSDYLLCWNKMTVDEAVLTGIPQKKLLIAGIIGYSDRECVNRWVSPGNNTFGVVLSHPAWEKQNLVLIDAANLLASRYGLKYYLKLHPNYSEKYFDGFVDDKYFLGCIRKGVSIEKYASGVVFSIIGNSSVLNELVYIRHNVIRLTDGSVDDKYCEVKYGLTFTTPQDILAAYDNRNFDMDNMFDYLCTVENVKKAYKDAFAQIII